MNLNTKKIKRTKLYENETLLKQNSERMEMEMKFQLMMGNLFLKKIQKIKES